MCKLIKGIFKVVGAVVGIYAVLNTLALAKMGVSRIAKQTMAQYPDGVPKGELLEAAVNVDLAALEEEEEIWEAWRAHTGK